MEDNDRTSKTSKNESELMKLEDRLRESEEKHKLLAENLPQKIFHKDSKSVYVSCNRNYAEALGISIDEIKGKTDFNFYPKALAEKYRLDDLRVMESGQTKDIEEAYINDGQEIVVQTIKTPLTDNAGNITGILGIFWDITARKKAEDELKKKIEELEQFHKFAVDRELKMIEMKKLVNAMSKELGRPEPYA